MQYTKEHPARLFIGEYPVRSGLSLEDRFVPVLEVEGHQVEIGKTCKTLEDATAELSNVLQLCVHEQVDCS